MAGNDAAADVAKVMELDIQLYDRMIRSALKKVLEDTANFAREAVRKFYILPADRMQDIIVDDSNVDSLTATITALGTETPVIELSAQQNQSGVRFQIKTDAVSLDAHAFIRVMQSGHQGIFKRTGQYGRMKRGSARGKIKEIIKEEYRIGFAEMVGSDKVIQAIEEFMSIRFEEELMKQMEEAA